jgi:hypothetical protein
MSFVRWPVCELPPGTLVDTTFTLYVYMSRLSHVEPLEANQKSQQEFFPMLSLRLSVSRHRTNEHCLKASFSSIRL